ncbi:armadillo-type protein [Russula aff. rugulosa BPL654]|nr:armadillo-type protein [Russula aff. rugulosa BPL654]
MFYDLQSDLKNLEASLLNNTGNVPFHDRFRALFSLKSLKTDEAVRIVSKAFQDPSALLKHELAYCLGQMKNATALPILESILADDRETQWYGMRRPRRWVLSLWRIFAYTKKYLNDPNRSVRETCEIAIAKIEWDHSEEGQQYLARRTTEPQFAAILFVRRPCTPTSSLLATSGLLADKSGMATVVYRAMFALRNIGTPSAVDALAAGFSDDSVLLKHEIAFVFGQLLSPHSVPALIQVLQDPKEADMVRHEAAEALGSIATAVSWSIS